MASFAPLWPVDGFLPLEDYGLIGDGTTAALVGRDGAIPWLCVPRFDAPPLFCGLLDAGRGGAFTVAPEDLLRPRGSPRVLAVLRGRQWCAGDRHARLLGAAAADRCLGPAVRGRPDRGRAGGARGAAVLGARAPRAGAPACRGQSPGRRAGGALGWGLRLRCLLRPALDLQLSSTVPLNGLQTTPMRSKPEIVSTSSCVGLEEHGDATARRILDVGTRVGAGDERRAAVQQQPCGASRPLSVY
jgi:hypothetical protein